MTTRLKYAAQNGKGIASISGEALLEIGLVGTSITLLTRQRAYWYLGIGFGVAGFIVCATVLLLHL